MEKVLQLLRQECHQRRLQLDEFMRTYDIHNNKKITKDQFLRALDNAGIRLSPSDLRSLQDHYQVPDEPLNVNYRSFCDDLDFMHQSLKGLEKNPSIGFEDALEQQLQYSSSSQLQKQTQLSAPEQQELSQLLVKLWKMGKPKGIVIKDVFRDFDRTNCGNVTKPQFLRNIYAVYASTVLTHHDAELLTRAYATEFGVNYRVLHQDMHALDEDGPHKTLITSPSLSPSPTSSLVPSSSSPAALPAQSTTKPTEQKLLLAVRRDRLRVKSFFSENDRLRSGKCTREQFKRSLKLCFGAGISTDDMNALIEKYSQGLVMNMVNYNDFCDAINPDVQYLASSSSSTAATCSPSLDRVMSNLSTHCTTKRILIKPVFQDFDKRRQGCVTTDQFCRVLTMFNLMPSTEEEKQLLLEYYAATTRHAPSSFMNFVTFCQDLETWNHRPDASSSVGCVDKESVPETTTHTSVPETHQHSYADMMHFIKEKVKRDRIRIEETFRDHDHLRKNAISTSAFSSALSRSGFSFSYPELEILASQYPSSSSSASSSRPLVAWMDFARDVNAIFTCPELEKDPLSQVARLVRDAERRHDSVSEGLSREEQARLATCLHKIKHTVDQKRLFIKPTFEDFDQVKRGYISKSKFGRALLSFDLLPPVERDVQIIVKKFQSINSITDVNYKAFIYAIETLGENTEDDAIPGTLEYRRLERQYVDEEQEQALLCLSSSTNNLNDAFSKLQNQPSTTTEAEAAVDLDELLHDIQSQMNKKRIRVREFLTEGDKLRTGEITVSKFHTALNRLGLRLEVPELACLDRKFISTKHQDKIDWRQFVSALEELPPRAEASLTSGAPEPPAELMHRIQNFVKQHRIHMKPYFQDYDRNHLNKVTDTQFASVCNFQLKLNPKEVEALNQAFVIPSKAQHSHSRSKDIDYLSFVRMIDYS